MSPSTLTQRTLIDRTRPRHICEALDDERAAYVYLRAVLPDLIRPASERLPLTEPQVQAMLAWQEAERHVHAIAGHLAAQASAK